MQFQPDRLEGVNTITRLAEGRVWVNANEHGENVIVPWRGPVQRWAVPSFEALNGSDFDAVVALQPDVVIVGTGARLRFPKPGVLRSLIERGIGFETMDSAAACRTYNVLAAEGRSVVAALLIEQAGRG